MSPISEKLALLGGADLNILRQAQRDRGKFVQMGCVLLTTSGIAAISMTFAIHNTMGVPVPIAVFFGFLWGLVILNLDRFLVVSMGTSRGWRLTVMAIPRLVLAIVVSLVISTPLTLEIFRSDIYAEMTSLNLQASQNIAKQEASSNLQQRANALQNQVNADNAILNGQLPAPVTSTQVQTAQAQVNQLQTQVSNAYKAEVSAYEAYQCELYGYGTGCAGGSGKVGYGPIAQAKKTIYEQDLTTYNSLNTQLRQAQANLATARQGLGQTQAQREATYKATAQQQLPGLKTQLAQLQAEIRQQDNYDQSTIAGNTGLLRQLQALFAASSGNGALLLAHLTLAALFFLIELLPVTIKVLLNYGPLSTYEQVIKAEDDKLLDAIRLDRKDERRKRERESDEKGKIEDAQSDARTGQALDMSQRQKDLGLKMNDHVAAKMEEILDAALAQWSSQVQARLNGSPLASAGGRTQATAGPFFPPPGSIGTANGHQPAAGQLVANGYQPAAGQLVANGYQAANGNGSEQQAQGPNPGFGLSADAEDML